MVYNSLKKNFNSFWKARPTFFCWGNLGDQKCVFSSPFFAHTPKNYIKECFSYISNECKSHHVQNPTQLTPLYPSNQRVRINLAKLNLDFSMKNFVEQEIRCKSLSICNQVIVHLHNFI